MWGSVSCRRPLRTIVADVVPRELRQRYFGLHFTVHNLGIAVGGIFGGLVLDTTRLVTFQAIYVVDAVTFLPAIFLLLGPLRHVGGRKASTETSRDSDSYAHILKRGAVRSVMLVSLTTSFVGYAMFNTGMPAFAREVSEVSTKAIGVAFAANAVVIVVVQLSVLRRIEGRRHTRVVALMGTMWALAWLLLGGSGLVEDSLGAAMLVAGCATVFALGETLLQPTIPTLVAELAPPHLRGRYNSLELAARQAGHVLAPPLAGVLLAERMGAQLIWILVSGCLCTSGYAIWVLERRLRPEENGAHPAPSPLA